ncbi:hypothetical protein BDW22DRAFT_1340697, partial [Trametopsis cervina]
QCPTCNEIETIEHILTKCKVVGQAEIWGLVEAALLRKAQHSPWITLGTIMGANLITAPPKNGHARPGTTRLQQILITESAYLIWKIRCERVIERGNDPSTWHSKTEVYNQWYRAINRRLLSDIALTHPKIPPKKRLDEQKVLNTWSGIIQHEDLFPENWIATAGVLVGKLTPRPGPEQRDNG